MKKIIRFIIALLVTMSIFLIFWIPGAPSHAVWMWINDDDPDWNDWKNMWWDWPLSDWLLFKSNNGSKGE